MALQYFYSVKLHVQNYMPMPLLEEAICLLTSVKLIILDFKSAYEGRAVVNLQMGNTFGAFLDINKALKVNFFSS